MFFEGLSVDLTCDVCVRCDGPLPLRVAKCQGASKSVGLCSSCRDRDISSILLRDLQCLAVLMNTVATPPVRLHAARVSASVESQNIWYVTNYYLSC